MTSPTEGQPGPDLDPGGATSPAETPARRVARPSAGRVADAGEAGPRQRGPARTAHSPGVEARLNRFVAGNPAAGADAAPARDSDAAPARQDGKAADTYGSELPDLSGPKPRPARKAAPARDGESAPATTSTRTAERRVQVAARAQGPVRASMQIRRIDPWSTLKVSLLLSVALFFAWMIAVAFLYLLLGSMGVWTKLNSNVDDLLTNTSGGGELVSSGTVFGGAALIGLINIVLLTAMATISALVYNLSTDLVGGIEVTLADRD